MPHNAPSSPADRRNFGRRQTVWHAWIAAPGRARYACMVRNVSTGGALLECEVPPWLPYEFRLIVEPYGIDVECDLRHRGVHGIGVQFKEPLNNPAVTSPDRPNTASLPRSEAERIRRHKF